MLTISDEIIRGWNARLSTNDYILLMIWILIRIQELFKGIFTNGLRGLSRDDMHSFVTELAKSWG